MKLAEVITGINIKGIKPTKLSEAQKRVDEEIDRNEEKKPGDEE